MYKLVLYGLLLLAGLSIVFSFFGLISYGIISLITTLIVLFISCYFSNIVFAKIFKVQTNAESSAITALILFFVVFPSESLSDIKMIILVSCIAMASKYILAIGKKHIFNPVAVSVLILGLFGVGLGAWWVGSRVLLLPMLILGFLVLRKVKRFELFFSFLVTSFLAVVLSSYINDRPLLEALMVVFVSGPALFFGTIMVTEPLTTPPTKKMQMVYGALVGGFFGTPFSFGSLYSTPELALTIGNVFSYFVSPRVRAVLTLVEKRELAGGIYDFIWSFDKKFSFKPGQYLEWTLGHNKPDSRGNRRFFTIASSPTEDRLHLGVKFYDNSSTFKKKLMSLAVGEQIVASQLAGEFTLPEDKTKKLVFLAGGIGVTPFRSMIKYMVDSKQTRDVVMMFSNRTPKDIVYKDIFDEAESLTGLKTIYAVNELAGQSAPENMRVGFINAEMIAKEVPDYKERIFYISGPHVMVKAFEDALSKMGISKSNIKVDFFPGFV